MKRFIFTVIAIITLATAIAQLQNVLPVSVQLFQKDRSEKRFAAKSQLTGGYSETQSPYAPPYQLNGVEVVDAFIDIDSRDVIEALKAQGVIINCEFDGFVTAQIPVNLLETVSTMHGVSNVEISKLLEFCTDTTLYVTRAGQVINGPEYNLPQAYDGTGVIVGIIDAGFDYQHLTYKRADNDSITRIVRIYDPEDTTGHPAYVGATKLRGSVFMDEQIDTMTMDAYGTHGTHTSSIAVGKHVEGYGGMAPGADIVLCTSRTLNVGISETQVANCIKYIYAYADSVNKPCVISVSVSVNNGSHDGTDRVAKAVAQNSGPGRIFVISAGNNGASYSYCSGPATLDNPLNILVGFNNTNIRCDDSYYYRYTWLDTWVRVKSTRPILKFHILDKIDKRIVWESEPINMTSTIDASQISDYFEPDLTVDTIGYLYGMVAVTSVGKYEIVSKISNLRCKTNYYNAEEDKIYSRYQIGLSIYPPKLTYPNLTDSIYLDNWICTAQGRLTAYNDTINTDAITEEGDTVTMPLLNYYAWPNNNCSMVTYAHNDSVISAGAFVARKSHYSLNGDSIIYDLPYTLNDAAGFSSYELEGSGPTGKALPTVSAPGYFVVAAASRYSYFESNGNKDLVMRKDGFPWGAMSGTSMAAPTVAGIIAQWLQINPNLSPSDVKRVIAETAIKDEFTSGPRFGPNGKIDAMAGARYLLGITDEEPPLLGDVNGDGKVSIKDLTMLINYLLTDDPTGINLVNADVSENGIISIKDLTMLINILLTQEVPGYPDK